MSVLWDICTFYDKKGSSFEIRVSESPYTGHSITISKRKVSISTDHIRADMESFTIDRNNISDVIGDADFKSDVEIRNYTNMRDFVTLKPSKRIFGHLPFAK